MQGWWLPESGQGGPGRALRAGRDTGQGPDSRGKRGAEQEEELGGVDGVL